MNIRMRHIRAGLGAALLASMMVTSGCKATPEHLTRWENRERSEEMFAKHLKDPDADHAVRVRALELLVKQWRYSSPMFRDGLIRDIPDPEGRESVVRDALPAIEKLFRSENETQRIYTRDALFSMRRQVESEGNLQAIDALLAEWLREDWVKNPCREIGGVRASQIFDLVGRENSEPLLVSVFDQGDWEKTYCALDNTKDLLWRPVSSPVASSLLAFWDKGAVPDGLQHRVKFLDELYTFAALPVVREWAFAKIRDEEVSTNDRGIMVALLSRSWVPEDLPKYKDMLKNADLYRWEAVRSLVTMQGAEGLDVALTNLPVDSDYAFWNGARRNNGFGEATNFVCGIPKMTESFEDMRPILARHAASMDNIYARAISIHCLGTLGDEASAATLDAIKRALNKTTDLEIPFWRVDEAMTVSQLIDQSIASIQTRVAAAAAAGAVEPAADAPAADAPAPTED